MSFGDDNYSVRELSFDPSGCSWGPRWAASVPETGSRRSRLDSMRGVPLVSFPTGGGRRCASAKASSPRGRCCRRHCSTLYQCAAVLLDAPYAWRPGRRGFPLPNGCCRTAVDFHGSGTYDCPPRRAATAPLRPLTSHRRCGEGAARASAVAPPLRLLFPSPPRCTPPAMTNLGCSSRYHT